MITKNYRFGDLVFQIATPIPLKEDARFEAFRSDDADKVDFYIEILPKEADPQERPVRISRNGERTLVELEPDLISGITLGNLLGAVQAALWLPDYGCFILHCAYVLHEGKALLLCAPSGTGKSTLAHYWNQCRGAKIINEDRALIIFREEQVYACGCWATGMARICENVTAPVEAVVLLGQGSENRIIPLRASEKLRRLVPQTSFDSLDSEQCRKIIDLVSDLMEKVKVIGYECIRDESAVDELEKNL